MTWYYSNVGKDNYKKICLRVFGPYCYNVAKVGPFNSISELKALYGTSININTMIANQQTHPYLVELNKLPGILKQLSSTATASNDEYFRYIKSHLVAKWSYDKMYVSFSKPNTIYGIKEISSAAKAKHIWEFTVTPGHGTPSYVNGSLQLQWVGIDSSMRKRLGEVNVDYKPNVNVSKYYEFNVWEGLKRSWKQPQTKFGESYKTKAAEVVVCMILDLSQKTLSFGVNGNQPQIAFHKVIVANNMKYSLCVTGVQNSNVNLLDYSVKDDEKQNDANEIQKLKKYYESMISSYQTQNMSLQTQNRSLQTQNTTLQTQNTSLQTINTSLQHQINQLQQNNNNNLTNSHELQTIKSKLWNVENENKTLRLKLTELENNAKKKKKNLIHKKPIHVQSNMNDRNDANDGNVSIYQQQINILQNIAHQQQIVVKPPNIQQNVGGTYGKCSKKNCNCVKFVKEVGTWCKCNHKQTDHK